MTDRLGLKSLTWFVGGFLFSAVSAFGQSQNAISSTSTELTGPVAREWVFKQIQVYLGPGNSCVQGDALIFYATQKVTIESCQNGQMTRQTVEWTIHPNGVFDPLLNYGGKNYELSFRDEGTKHYMRLREPSAEKTDPAFDRIFQLSDNLSKWMRKPNDRGMCDYLRSLLY